MKNFILILSFILATSSPIFAQPDEFDTIKELINAEKLRFSTLVQIKNLYSDKPDFISAFEKSEKKWMEYRDAQLEMIFPGENKQLLYGSVYRQVYNIQKIRLTKQHTNELEHWVNGVPEGVLDWGSVMMDQEIRSKKSKKDDEKK